MNAAEIAAALADKVEALALDLFGAPAMKSAAEWRYRGKGSLVIYMVPPPRRGHFRDFEADERGDALDLIAAARSCSLKDAYRWARDWLGNPTSVAPISQPIAFTRRSGLFSGRLFLIFWMDAWHGWVDTRARSVANSTPLRTLFPLD